MNFRTEKEEEYLVARAKRVDDHEGQLQVSPRQISVFKFLILIKNVWKHQSRTYSECQSILR